MILLAEVFSSAWIKNYTLSTPKAYLSECTGEILASITSLKVHP